MTAKYKPVVLAILDGWGLAPPGEGNAITEAKTPNMTKFWNEYVHTQLIAHGESVGLPKREPGNTETGHLNIGAGTIVYQDLPRINMSVADGSFFQNPKLGDLVTHVKRNNSKVHIMGLIGGGGVHSEISHFIALLRFFSSQAVTEVYVHAFTDGRDSPPTSATTFINQLEAVMSQEKVGKFASVMGRYYAMDRDFRWDRTERAYKCLTQGIGKPYPSIQEAVSTSYSSNLSDEFIEPSVIVDKSNVPIATIKASDAVVFVNFRIDRPRQLTKAFVLPDFENTANTNGWDPYAVEFEKKHTEVTDPHRQKPFIRGPKIENLYFATMTEYEHNLPTNVLYPPELVANPIAKVISDNSLKQLHISESEKERFVTYYLDGMNDGAYSGEDWQIIPSPKVATYDKKPEMSARELTTKIIENIQSGRYDFIAINYANADMVGHTGKIDAAIKAIETIDVCMGQLTDAVLAAGGAMLITADHGNAEEMINLTTGMPDTEHNANPVPCIIISKDHKTGSQIKQGILADVAPTILDLMNIPHPISMSGRNLLSTRKD